MSRWLGLLAGVCLAGWLGSDWCAAAPPSQWVAPSDDSSRNSGSWLRADQQPLVQAAMLDASADAEHPAAKADKPAANTASPGLSAAPAPAAEKKPVTRLPAVESVPQSEPAPPVELPARTEAVAASPSAAVVGDDEPCSPRELANPACRGRFLGPQDDSEPVRLLALPGAEARRLRLSGWLDQGVTLNPQGPVNRFNGPVSFNDRSNEYQLNQLYLYAERLADTGGSGVDWGGRIDALYGTDWRFLASSGFDAEWNGAQRFYGVAMPQMYADVAIDEWTFRTGKFISPLGFDNFMAPDNFFYSHTYAMQYGEPKTFTGFLARYNVTDRLSAAAGVAFGWDRIVEADAKASLLASLSWTSDDDSTTVDLGLTTSSEPAYADSSTTLVTFVLTHRLSERLRGVVQYDGGVTTNANPQVPADEAQWNAFNFWLFYDINACWTLGFRYEWFNDPDGIRVAGIGDPHGFNWAAVPGNWQDIALGLNYRPGRNVTCRTEVRWDWFGDSGTPNRPFDDYNRGSQFLWSTDLIVRF